MTAPILTYFDFPGGRGEDCRLALEIAGVDWVDNRLSGDWPAAKASTPFGALPTLEVPGKGVLAQSNAILAYLGREYGLLPADSWQAARHEAMMNAVEDLRAAVATTDRADEDDKRKAREEFAAGYFRTWATDVSEQIRGPFLDGDALSVADLKIFVGTGAYARGIYDHIPKDILEPFPKITALRAAVAAHPRVAAWYSK
jgi:glutathione S-transferase